MKISAVIPVYNEEGNIIPVYQELEEKLQKITNEFEIIVVDDGSKDKTLIKLLYLLKNSKNLRIIEFEKNYGKSAALTAGFAHVRGDSVITLDGDGQDDPNNIPNLIDALNEDFDVVCGWRANRNDKFLKRLNSRIYNFLNRKINRINIHDSNCTLRIYRKEVVSDLKLPKGAHRYIPTILLREGYRISEVEVIHRKRLTGKSRYGFRRLFVGFFHLFRVKSFLRAKSISIYEIKNKYGFN